MLADLSGKLLRLLRFVGGRGKMKAKVSNELDGDVMRHVLLNVTNKAWDMTGLIKVWKGSERTSPVAFNKDK